MPLGAHQPPTITTRDRCPMAHRVLGEAIASCGNLNRLRPPQTSVVLSGVNGVALASWIFFRQVPSIISSIETNCRKDVVMPRSHKPDRSHDMVPST